MPKSTGKKGAKKIGRNLRKPACARYRNEMRWVKNKIKKLKRHLKKHPNDRVAIKAKEANRNG